MKALDTPVLLAILEGVPAARDLLRRLKGSELATTEANLLELTLLASAGPRGRRTGLLP
jgi:predicted nucleic acid-binding protein